MKRLIVFIFIFVIFLAFIVFNLDNKCDISLGFKTFKDIPVFLSALCSFGLGMVFAVPLIFTLRRKHKKTSDDPGSSSDASKKKRGQSTGTDEYNKENSPYGID